MMSDFVIPKKFPVSLNFPKPLSPILHESFILKPKTGETAKAGDLRTKLTSGNLSYHFGVLSSSIPETWLTDRQRLPVKTILKTGAHGGSLKMFGSKIVDGPKTMKNFQIRVSTLDNKKIFKSLGIPPRKAVKSAMKTLSKNEQNALMESYIVKRQKVKQSFQPPALKASQIVVRKPMAPKVSKNTLFCSHLKWMVKNPDGPATLKHATAISYK